MLGLFLILPVFALYAQGIPGGDNLTLVGLALGAYGLTQALFQIPFGMASDRFGRKRVIVLGLVLFALGSFIAASAQDIYITILGRCLQGAGAISAAVSALAADLTREQHRTKVMAMIGSSIGLVFAGSLVAAPVLYGAIGMSGLFIMTGVLALLAVILLHTAVPNPPPKPAGPTVRFAKVLLDRELMRLNFGIFTLHLAQMAMFVVVPGLLLSAGALPVGEHWKVYLPVVLGSFVLMVPAIIVAEKKRRVREVFLAAIGLLLITEFLFAASTHSFVGLVGALLAFFVAFNILEATLPSLISRFAPPSAKGAALGIYNTTQAFGLFLGGLLGGTLAKHGGAVAVFASLSLLVLVWGVVASGMKAPPNITRRELPIPAGLALVPLQARLVALPGMVEAIVVAEPRMAYLRINLDAWDESRLTQIFEGEC
ncbi:MAG: hypothetical protein RIR70_2099 [Pseudomonadota bacterium]